MKTAFIVRPFGVKHDARGKEIDFDRVQQELIEPAMQRAGLRGDTTAEIARAGNIRADMFELLAKADLVIADVSIHNANVFYELGVRQALRDKRTFLIRCQADEIPFDLKTDRYLTYDRRCPETAVDSLAVGLAETLAGSAVDSPIFQMVPQLEPQDWTRLMTLPPDFREEVEIAAGDRRLGDLELLSVEARDFGWAAEGLRLIGQAQYYLEAWEGARETWQALLYYLPADVQANYKLGTIYQRLGDLAASDVAIRRVIDSPALSASQRAHGFSLLGSNEKKRWHEAWRELPDADKPLQALGSRYLRGAQQAYANGFASDLNHYYSGINALALAVLVTELAGAHPQVWQAAFDTPQQAECRLSELSRERQQLEGAVTLSVRRHLEELARQGKTDRWAEITEAGIKFLTVDSPERVAMLYRKAFEGAKALYFGVECRQLRLFQQLGVLPDVTAAALHVLSEVSGRPGVCSEDLPMSASPRVVLFTGHRIDDPDRQTPRFPPVREARARQAIKDALVEEQQRAEDGIVGLAGGASGGDILFHEICAELQIESQLLLAIPGDSYIDRSVRVAGAPDWVERFRKIEKHAKPRLLCKEGRLPSWLAKREENYVWVRNNLWTLYNALAHGGSNVTLIALWNGETGDGPGGTAHMVQEAKARGAKVVILDTRTLFDL